ncbi:unnamed protein product [Lupinus luteus]|uniref:Uncharacterized protein n=1 Tax=Lupinus luteus TaxID=3873 RepID=A0AAV1X2C2_LUPLU
MVSSLFPFSFRLLIFKRTTYCTQLPRKSGKVMYIYVPVPESPALPAQALGTTLASCNSFF